MFRCIVNNATPCVSIIKFDAKTGVELDKPIRKYKACKLGKTVPWVDECSRKHFVAVSDKAKKLNRDDFKRLKAELNSKLKATDPKIPNNATLSEIAHSLEIIKARNTNSKKANQRRTFLPEPQDDDADLTSRELKDLLDKKGISYPPQANKTKLKLLLDGGDCGDGPKDDQNP